MREGGKVFGEHRYLHLNTATLHKVPYQMPELLKLPELLNDIGLAAVPNWWSKLDVRCSRSNTQYTVAAAEHHETWSLSPTQPPPSLTSTPHVLKTAARGSLYHHPRADDRTRARALGIR